MLPHRNGQEIQVLSPAEGQLRRQSRDGDWVCFRCSNYNYSFREICNRCKTQTKSQNFPFMGQSQGGFGEDSFPSALFIALCPFQQQDWEDCFMCTESFLPRQEALGSFLPREEPLVGVGLMQNTWIHNLINE